MRVVIAEDSVLLREGLVRLLASAGIEVSAAVGDPDALLRAVTADPPDLALVDVRIPPTFRDEGLRAALVLRRTCPEVAVLVLSQYVEERYATELLGGGPGAGGGWGGLGYLLKDRVADVGEFIETLRRVAAGGTALDPEVVAQLIVRSRRDPLARLTPREREVLARMAEGRSNAGIRDSLGHQRECRRQTCQQHLQQIGPGGDRGQRSPASLCRAAVPQRMRYRKG
jgi:DNA-binding NarL/FixJ family response regulator